MIADERRKSYAARSQLRIDHGTWPARPKAQFRAVQLKAALLVNTELLTFYWQLGAHLVAKQGDHAWGHGLVKQLSHDLRVQFPEVEGFSVRNIEQIRQWVTFWSATAVECKEIRQRAVEQLQNPPVPELLAIPWGHNLTILAKCRRYDEALFYVKATLEHGWSQTILVHQIESDLWRRKGAAVTNSSAVLPPPQSDLAREVLKDPYVFDFLSVTDEHNERELERDLVAHITQFLIELGAGFACVGRQVPLPVGDTDFFLDLLFYHVHLHCYVVIELNTGDFKPEFVGKLNFYVTAVDETMRSPTGGRTIGLLLCKNKDGLVPEYAMRDISKPMGVSTYTLAQMLPDELRDKLPSIEALQQELGFAIDGTEGET